MKSILKSILAATILVTAGATAQANEIDSQIMLLDMQLPNPAQECAEMTMSQQSPQIMPEMMSNNQTPAEQGVIAVNIMPETGGFETQMQDTPAEFAPTCSAFNITSTYDI